MRRNILASAAAVLAVFTLSVSMPAAHVGDRARTQDVAVAPLVALNPVQQLLAAEGAETDQFGTTIAMAGDLAVIGAPNAGGNAGAAYVFRRVDGTWIQEARFAGDNPFDMKTFGAAVAVSGDTVLVGAPREDSWRGAVYVYVKGTSGWSRQAKLGASDAAAMDQFGISVALDGNRAVVGASRAAVGDNWSQGAAYVFGRTSTVWTQTAKLVASDGDADDWFGQSVALQGDHLVAGVPGDDVGLTEGAGTARVFAWSGSTWVAQGVLQDPAGAKFDALGTSVAIDGDTVMAGAPATEVDGLASAGSVHVFVRAAGAWKHQEALTAPSPAADEQFGAVVDVDADTAMVGVVSHAVGGNDAQGAAFVFTRQGTNWSDLCTLEVSDGAAGDHLGTAVAVDDGVALAGAPWRVVDGHPGQGAAYAFGLPPAVLGIAPRFGRTGGGTAVTVIGQHFVPGATMTLGGTAAVDPVVTSPTQMTATTPPHFAGPASVVVTNPDGSSGILPGGFTFAFPPALYNLTPSHGTASGNTPVTIDGSSFETGATVTFGGVASPAVTFVDEETLVAVTPPHVWGQVHVDVTNANGLQSENHEYCTYDRPVSINLVTPNSGRTTGDTAVDIGGERFAPGATVSFGGTPATSVLFVNANLLVARTPAHPAGAVDVVVRNPDGEQALAAGGYTYSDVPIVESMTPTTMPSGEWTLLEITGHAFHTEETVLVGNVYVTGESRNASNLYLHVPPHGRGTYDVSLVLSNAPPTLLKVPGQLTFEPLPGRERQHLMAPANPHWNDFGDTMVLGGNRLLVGDPGPAGIEFEPGQTGKVHVFSWNGTEWVTESTLAPDDSAQYDRFGASIACDGTTAVISAPGRYSGGAVYVFERSGIVWTQTAKLVVGGGRTSSIDLDVGLSGNRFVVGVPQDSVVNPGEAKVYVRSGALWVLEGTIQSPVLNSRFGDRVAIDGTTIAVWDRGQSQDRVQVYEYMDGGWGATATLSPPAWPGATTTNFGTDLAMEQGTLLVGASAADTGAGAVGAAYVFQHADGEWALTATLAPNDPALLSRAGQHVVLRGDRAALSAMIGGAAAAFLFERVGETASNAWQQVGRFVSSVGSSEAGGVALTDATIVLGEPKCYGALVDDGWIGCANVFQQGRALESVTPTSGPVGGGAVVEIVGRDFSPGAVVTFGGVPAAETAVLDTGRIVATTPAHAAGAVDVAVTDSGGAPLVLEDAFTYVEPPVITAVTPGHGNAGTIVTITGTGFPTYYMDNAWVSFDRLTVGQTDTQVVDATTIVVTVPPGGPGPADVAVAANGARAELRDAFVYDPVPGQAAPILNPYVGSGSTTTFGASIAVRGDLAVVANSSSGYSAPQIPVAFRRATGRWHPEHMFSSLGYYQMYGQMVATDGSAVAVHRGQAGSVTIFETLQGAWRQAATFYAPEEDAQLAMDAGRLAVGLRGQAQVRVFARNGDAWAWTQVIEPPAPVPAGYGRSVAIDGSWLAVGSETSVRTYEKVGNTWVPRTVLESPKSGIVFGHAVAIEGTTIAVGVPSDNPSGAANRGSVYFFEYSGGTWNIGPQLTASDGHAGDLFGSRVRLNGNWLAVQAPGVNSTGSPVGAVYLYERRAGVWQLNGKLVPWAAAERFTLDIGVGDHELFVGTTSGVALYPLPPVVVGGVHPWLGPTAGGAVVTIYGQSFKAGMAVTIGGVAATGVTVVEPQTLTARTGAHAAGPADIVVRHPNGLSGTLAGGYTYRDVDLLISSLTGPAAMGPGERGDFVMTTKNAGPGAVPSSVSTLYLSSNTVVDGSDILLSTQNVPPLNAGKTAKGVLTVQIPAGMAAGSYYLIGVADAGADVGERLETNNTKSKALEVGCDLIVSVITAPAGAIRGASVIVSATTKNTGPGQTPASTTKVYFSADTTIDKDDVLVLTSAVGVLNPGATSKSATVSWKVPVGTAVGRYYILAKADTGNAVPETDETNNVKSKAFTVR